MGAGKRAGSRRGPRKRSSLQPSLLALAGGVTLAVVAWGYLVYAAIDFGSTARGGDQQAWIYLGVASLGAVACLFSALMLVSRLLRRLGITSEPGDPGASRARARSRDRRPQPPAPPASDGPVPTLPPTQVIRPPGSRRAAR